jgi:hypothetical protein
MVLACECDSLHTTHTIIYTTHTRRAVREWPAFWNPTRPTAVRLLHETLGDEEGHDDEEQAEERERALLEDSPVLPTGNVRGLVGII